MEREEELKSSEESLEKSPIPETSSIVLDLSGADSGNK
jgi:hypothetical protein